jgi:hypothetical protein
MERRKSEFHPFVWIRGRVEVDVAENENLSPGFQDVASLALLDTGNDVTIITQECLRLNFGRKQRVWFTID